VLYSLLFLDATKLVDKSLGLYPRIGPLNSSRGVGLYSTFGLYPMINSRIFPKLLVLWTSDEF